MKEVSKEEILKLKDGDKYIVFNPLTNTYKEETIGKNDIAHNKHCYSGLKFYLEEEIFTNEKK